MYFILEIEIKLFSPQNSVKAIIDSNFAQNPLGLGLNVVSRVPKF